MFKNWNNLTTKVLIKMSLVFLIFLFSCKRDDIEIDDIKTETYFCKYMNYPSTVYPSRYPQNSSYINWKTDLMGNDTISIYYDNNKIVKRIGHFLTGSSSVGYYQFFSRVIYDTLIYTNNQLTILTKSSSKEITSVSDYKKVVFYENDRISKTVQSYQIPFKEDKTVTVYYIYSKNLLIKKIGYSDTNLYFQTDFYYNNSGNLDSIVSRMSEYNFESNNYEIDFSSKNKIKEVFESYDKSKNQLKPFIIFDETFNRSLSANNYGKYNYYYFDSNGIAYNEWHYTYNLKYENGVVNFAK